MKIALTLTFLFAGFFAGVLPVSSQTPGKTPPPLPARQPFHAFFEYFGEEEGVPGAVSLIRQDRRGYLWCALTNNGLLRFDGMRFRHFAHNPDNPASLPDNDIRDILEDRNGTLWLASKTGIIRFDPLQERFQHVGMRTPGACLSLLEDKTGRIWAGTAGSGLAYFDPSRDSFLVFPGAGVRNGYTGAYYEKTSFDRFAALAETEDGILWSGATLYRTNGTALPAPFCIDAGRQTRVFYAPAGRPDAPPGWESAQINLFTFVRDQGKQVLWMSGAGVGLVRFSLDGYNWRQEPCLLPGINPNDLSINAILSLGDTALWLGTNDGLKYLNLKTGQCAAFTPAPGQPGGYRDDVYHAIFRDREGAIWFGCGRGLSRLDPYRQQFPIHSPLPAHFNAQAIADYAPTGEQLFAVWDSDNFFRVMAWNPRTGKYRQSAQRLPYKANDMPAVHQLFVAPDRRIWVLLNRGIGWLDPLTLQLRFPDLPVANNSGIRTNAVWPRHMTADNNGKLWIATFGNGIIRYDPEDGSFWRPAELPALNGARREFNTFIFNIFCDQEGRLWLGECGTGIEIWDPKAQTRVLFQPRAENFRSLSGLFVKCIIQDVKGNIWVGAETGLCRYLPGMPADSAFERVNGLHEEVHQIAAYPSDRLWLTTSNGLYCYVPGANVLKKFGKKQGMTLALSALTPLFKSSNGQIWLGDDLNFNPDKIDLFPPPAIPMITGFRIYDHTASLPARTAKNGVEQFFELTLQPDQEVFTIETGLLGFTAPEQTRLLYRLRDDDPWSEAGEQRAFTFNRLPGGHYRFSLKSIGPDGTDTGYASVLPLRVVPPFYRAVWFWTLCAALFAAGIYALFRYREIQRLQQEKLRLRIARDLHDEMGSTLSSISILSEAALRNLQADIDRARFGAIGERTRQVMEAMSDIVWSVNPRNDNMANVLQRMKQFAVEILEPQGIALHFEADEAVATLNLPMEQRKDFYLLFKEAVNNAAKYSGARDVWVRVQAENGSLSLEVRDNGRGFDVEQVKRGNGLWNMQRRAERMGGRFLAESNVGTGTTIAAIITTPK